jgi:hypothetical protein
MTTKQQVLDLIDKQISKLKPTRSVIQDSTNIDIAKALNKLRKNIINRIETEVPEPQVKQLVWVERNAMYFITTALGNVVYYEILYKLHEEGNYFVVIHNGKADIGVSDTLDEAKAYAQQHFEELIKRCME